MKQIQENSASPFIQRSLPRACTYKEKITYGACQCHLKPIAFHAAGQKAGKNYAFNFPRAIFWQLVLTQQKSHRIQLKRLSSKIPSLS